MQNLGLGAGLMRVIGDYSNQVTAPPGVCEDQACSGLGWTITLVHMGDGAGGGTDQTAASTNLSIDWYK